ncbi:MAG: NACHT domain-containing protein, partial [Nitrososphaera sp.]|nr:NACHT domain-containing protein [Nitrososphaera sp.]
MPDFSIAIGLLKKPLEDLYSLASGALQGQIATLKAQTKVKKLHKRLWESQRVKTIWHTDKPLSLTSFFYPVSVSVETPGTPVTKSTKVNGLDNLPDPHTIIFGTVGQGKSILLRFLLGRELRSGNHIPLLCELRNVESQSLWDYLGGRFSMLLEISPDDKLFTFFASHGKIAFLLDGFDEVMPKNVPRLSQELEDLATRFPACPIALTSRPDSECRHLTSFHTARIEQLSGSDLEPFYRKIGHDVDFAKRLVAAIARSPTRIRELVVTPLLATLLAISYRAAQKIPLDFSEFYEELFQILLIRHDASKLGWKRSRKTSLNDRDFQQVFEAFCFSTRKRRLTALSADDAIQVSKDTLTSLKLTADSQHVIDDIRRITCLLVEEGSKLQFVHNSVQEFFAARYVKTQTEPVAASFYAQILTGGKWTHWQEELLFLQKIDAHRATKYFFLPDLKVTLDFLLQGAPSWSSAIATRYLEGMAVKRSIVKRDGKDVSTYFVHRIRSSHTFHLQILDNRVFGKLFSGRAWH